MKTSLILILTALSSVMALAQVSVKLTVDRKQYLAHEPVTAVVTITNRSGRELSYVSQARGRIARSWLDFSARDGQGRGLPKLNHRVFQKAVIPAGRSLSRRVNLSSIFGLSRPGNFAVTAHVTNPGTEDTSYTSNSGHFTVSTGSTIYTQQIGVPNTRAPKRTYNVITFNDGKRTSIYAQVMNTVSKRSISTLRLSEYLYLYKPQMTLDGKNNLHVLYLANPDIFVHATITPDGAHTGTQYFKRTNARGPRFVAFQNGKIGVRGASPYDPKKEAAKAPKARRASDRPN